jgi:16S rRNA (uracil1498-N3)-methyltransferase
MDGTREIFGKIKPGMSVGIFIGPEGGFEESEVEKAKELGISPVTLGKRILRTETAGLTTLSILMYLLEEA